MILQFVSLLLCPADTRYITGLSQETLGVVLITNVMSLHHAVSVYLNTFRLRQNGHHFADDIFKYIHLNGIYSIFYTNFFEICSQWSNYRYASIGSDDGLSPSRRIALIWTNFDLVYWRRYASLGFNEWNGLGIWAYWGWGNIHIYVSVISVMPVITRQLVPAVSLHINQSLLVKCPP